MWTESFPRKRESTRRRWRYGFRVTQHAQQEMVEEDITLDEVVQAIRHGEIAEVAQGPLSGPAAFPAVWVLAVSL
ncbi:MAG: DUF4258 domain-containing protein [Terriglobia bacterium]